MKESCLTYERGRVTPMSDFTNNTTPLKFTKSRNSNLSVQIQVRPKSKFEFVPRDTEESDFPDLVDFGV